MGYIHSADCTLTKLRTPESQFLHHQAVLHVRHAGAAVALERGAVEAHLTEGLYEFLGKAPVAVALLDDGDEVLFDVLPGAVAHQALVVREQGIELDEVHSLEFKGHGFFSFAMKLTEAWESVKPGQTSPLQDSPPRFR
jgi:hypothetical protein